MFLTAATSVCAQSPAEIRVDPIVYADILTPRYTHIQKFSASCTVTGDVVSVFALLNPESHYYQASLSVTLQRYTRGQWKNVKTWTATGMWPSGASVESQYAVTDGTYRVKATGKVLDGTKVLETATVYG